MVERLFLAVPRGCLRFVIVVFPDHTHLLFLNSLPLDIQYKDALLVYRKTAVGAVVYNTFSNTRITSVDILTTLFLGLTTS